MGCFARMNEKGRRAGRRKGGGKLAADVAGFSDAGNDEAAAAAEDSLHGQGKVRRVAKTLGCGKNGVGFVRKDIAAEADGSFSVVMRFDHGG